MPRCLRGFLYEIIEKIFQKKFRKPLTKHNRGVIILSKGQRKSNFDKGLSRASNAKEGDDMANISNIIEQFLLELFADGDNVNISRNELADYFSCAPSLINYVLMTRFTPARGYIIESRRGGGGYISVTRLSDNRNKLLEELASLPVSSGMTHSSAVQVLCRLTDSGVMDKNTADLLSTVMTDKAIVAPAMSKNAIRAGMMRSLAAKLLKKEESDNGGNKNV